MMRSTESTNEIVVDINSLLQAWEFSSKVLFHMKLYLVNVIFCIYMKFFEPSLEWNDLETPFFHFFQVLLETCRLTNLYPARCSLPKMKKAIWSLGQKTSFLRVEMMFQSISIFWWLSNSVTRKWRRVEQRKKLPTGHMFVVVIFVAKNSISEALSRKLNKAPSRVKQAN